MSLHQCKLRNSFEPEFATFLHFFDIDFGMVRSRMKCDLTYVIIGLGLDVVWPQWGKMWSPCVFPLECASSRSDVRGFFFSPNRKEETKDTYLENMAASCNASSKSGGKK